MIESSCIHRKSYFYYESIVIYTLTFVTNLIRVMYFVFFKVEYLIMPGWQTSTENVRQFKDLPDNAKRYVNKIEDLLNVPGNYFLLILLPEYVSLKKSNFL